MADLDKLKRGISEKNEGPKFKGTGASEAEPTEIDMEKVENIVKRMKEKYKEQGIEFDKVRGPLSELRGLIAEGMAAKIEIQTVEELKEFKSKLVQFLAGVYIKLGRILKPIAENMRKFPEMEMLSFYLYSANMPYSNKQYTALTVAGAAIAFLIALLFSTAILTIINVEIATRILAIAIISILAFVITALVILMIPRQKAITRGGEVSIELPFALRHMATELRAGIGLYRTIQAVASSDYGVLSEEFARVITEVEEGTDTKDALKHLALRTQSKALRNAIIHIGRALKTGGNLSESMSDIAEDVSFEMRMAVREFGERMNFFGVVFIFGAIVMLVMMTILGSIRNSPISKTLSSFQSLPLTIPIMATIYLVVMPIILGMFLLFIKKSQPRV